MLDRNSHPVWRFFLFSTGVFSMLCLLTLDGFCQTFEARENGRIPNRGRLKRDLGSSSALAVFQKPFDVLHYDLYARPAMIDSSFSGRMSIQCRITYATDSLTFHSVGLVFDSVSVGGSLAPYRMYPQSETFSVTLPRVYAVGETVAVTIGYFRDPNFPRFEERQGYYWYPRDYQPGLVLENIGYTLSAPSDARLWMPCFDDPSDKATCAISVEVPTGYTAASNGALIGITSTDSTTIFRWREDSAVASYLMCITASKYSSFSHYYRKVTSPSESLEVKYYMWQADSAGPQFNAVQAFSKTTRMMETFARMFGEYPFVKYGMAAVYPFSFGGMEHQTMTSVHKSWLSVSGYPYHEDDIAHELAHQWWGNMVTCQTWADIWLNEGFASYCEALWREHEYGRASYDQKMRNFRTFDISWRLAMYDPVGQGLPLFNGSVYYKGAWVLHMLRAMIGDSLFYAVLSNYRTVHGYSTATTLAFRNMVNTGTGMSFDWFFDQWVFGRGWPSYAYTTSYDSSDFSYTVTVFQVQDALWPTFRSPLELKLFTPAGALTYVVFDSLRVQNFIFYSNTRPDSLQFDPRNLILKQMTTTPVGFGGDMVPASFVLHQNYPNPFNPSTTIEYDLPVRSWVRIEVFDVLGRRIERIVNESKPAGSHRVRFSADGIPTGVYFVRMQTDQSISIRKMTIIR
jgi:aminopeptidase N